MIATPHSSDQLAAAAADFSTSPMLVFYEVTRACDLVCRHCRACAAPKPAPGELTSAESQQLIDQLAEFPSPPLLVITGGDPLKRPDLFELITYAKGKGLDVSITPSATPLVTRPAIERLRDCGISRMAISIDGADADTHDAFRGFRGSFDRSLEILRDAHRAGLSTQINTTLTPENIHQVDRMADLFAELSIDLWSVFFLVPVGRGAILPRLSAEQCENAFERLWAHSRTQPYAIKTTEAPHYRRYVIQHQVASGQKRTARPAGFVTRGVNDGKGILFISYCGMIYPSGFLPILCGVFPQSSVVRVYQDSPIMRALRESRNLQGKCGACEFRKICGGSRARAYAVTGNLFAQEPDCSYLPRGWEDAANAQVS